MKVGDRIILKEVRYCKNKPPGLNIGLNMDMEKLLDGKTIYTVKKVLGKELFYLKENHWTWTTEWVKEILGKDMIDFKELDKVIGIMEGK